MSKSSSARALLFGVGLLTLLVFTRSTASAQSNTVRAILCDTAGPIVQVTEPESDSIVDTPTVNLEGTTIRTSQIELYINEAYSQSIAVEPNGPFSANVPLNKGTNTIRIEAYFACNQTTEIFNVVVTYEPKVVPSPGETTDTSVPGGGIIPPTISNPYPVAPPAPEDPSPIRKALENLRLITPADPESRTTTENTLIVTTRSWMALIVGVVLVFAVAVPGVFLAAVGKLFGVAGYENLRGMRQLHKNILRAAAAVLLFLMLYVLQA